MKPLSSLGWNQVRSSGCGGPPEGPSSSASSGTGATVLSAFVAQAATRCDRAAAGTDLARFTYDLGVLATPDAPDWVALTDEVLPVDDATRWAATPGSGAVVTFCGVVRDHSEGRPGVTKLSYEAYESEAVARLQEVVAETRRRWPVVERLALLHRTGDLELTETSVVVVASAPHRPEAFEAARFAIDTLKETVPIWKREHWADGSDWGQCAHDVRPVAEKVVR
jgi:molybdopterin synthase catalytic subunit